MVTGLGCLSVLGVPHTFGAPLFLGGTRTVVGHCHTPGASPQTRGCSRGHPQSFGHPPAPGHPQSPLRVSPFPEGTPHFWGPITLELPSSQDTPFPCKHPHIPGAPSSCADPHTLGHTHYFLGYPSILGGTPHFWGPPIPQEPPISLRAAHTFGDTPYPRSTPYPCPPPATRGTPIPRSTPKPPGAPLCPWPTTFGGTPAVPRSPGAPPLAPPFPSRPASADGWAGHPSRDVRRGGRRRGARDERACAAAAAAAAA